MNATQRLRNGQKNIKPAYLIETKEELIKERDELELNWDESKRDRINQLQRQSIVKFKTPLSRL